MKKKQRVLLYYTALAATLNSVMLFGRIQGWWS